MAAPCAPKVEVGQRRDGKVEIVEGIGGSDTIVVAGWQRLRDGAPVRASERWQPATAPIWPRLVRRRSPGRTPNRAVPATKKRVSGFLLKAPFDLG